MSILTCFLLALIPCYVASVNFSFPNITPNNSKDIILSGDAYTTDDGIQVTYKKINRSGEGLAGRATYIRPLHLWDNDSTDLASFTTSFTFSMAVYPENDYIPGDGLTFFLAQNNSVINTGGSMGLPFDFRTNTSLSPFVAVEFDTYDADDWDSPRIGDHVGININSLKSVVSELWNGYINYGTGIEFRAVINYSSDSKILSVSYTNYENAWRTGLNYTIDLRGVLPEWVIFGFSASTGDGYEKNNVRSWTFNSTEIKGGELPPTINVDQTSSVPPTENNDQSSSVAPTKNIDQSSSLPLITTGKDVGKVGLTLVLVFHYMALLL